MTCTLSKANTSVLSYDDVAELFSTGDYLFEVQLSFDRNLSSVQRRGQFGDLQKCLDLLDTLEKELPDQHSRVWASQLKDKAQRCLFRIQTLIAFGECVSSVASCRPSNTPAA